MKITMLCMSFALVLPWSATAQKPPDEMAELKQRMKDRYPQLEKLINGGKVGECWDGTVDAVKPEYLKEAVDKTTVKDLLAAENKDRDRLYALLATGNGVTAAKVGEQNGDRKFEKAAPGDWLKTRDGKWVKKKDLPAKPASAPVKKP